jgi:parallel beta-helix repeat protein
MENMRQKNMLKAVIVIVVALAFVLPGSAVFTNIGTPGVTSNDGNTDDIKNIVGSPIDNRITAALGSSEPVVPVEPVVPDEPIVPDSTNNPDVINLVDSIPLPRGTIYVDDNRPPDWYDTTHVKTIQEGVNNASAGDTILVYNGMYCEKVNINKRVNLIGECKEHVIVDGGSGSGNVFNITTPVMGVNISKFTIKNGRCGIQITTSSYNSITKCNLYGNTNNGLLLSGGSSNNTIKKCNAYNNGHYGIALFYSPNNVITNCNAYNNQYGIYINSYNNDSNNNAIYHNNLINNTYNAKDPYSNIWDDGYPSGGNYWSDYTGVDEYSGPGQNIPGSDGIGDTPYVIPGGNNSDRYPLMNPLNIIPITITIKGGIGVSVMIKNTGTTDLTNINWTITLNGSMIFVGKTKSETITSLPAGQSVTVKDFVLGFGKTGIAVDAGGAEASASGTVILFFVIRVA